MFIEKIILSDFRNLIGEHTYTFTKGINLFYGGNFSGKSSIFKAISFCFNINDPDNKSIEEYINDYKESFSIQLLFSHNGNNYLEKVEYFRNNKIPIRELYINDFSKPVYNTPSSVKEHLSLIIDPFLGEHSLIMMQDTLSIINAKDSDRLELFKKIRNINFKKQVDELDAQIKKLKDEDLKEIEINLIALEKKEYHEQELKEEILTGPELKEFEITLSTITEKINEYDNQIKQFEQKKEKTLEAIEETDSSLNTYQKTIDKKEQSIIEEQENYKKDELTLQQNISELEKKLLSVFDDSHIIEERNKDIQKINSILESKEAEYNSINLTRKRWKSFEEEIENLIEEKNTLQVEKNIILKTLEACKDGKCPTCRQNFSIDNVEKHKGQLEEIEVSFTKVNDDLKVLKKAKEDQDIEKKEYDFKRNKKNLLSQEIESLKSKIEDTEKNYNYKLQQERLSFENNKDSNKKLLEKDKESLQYKKQTKDQRISSWKEDISEYKKLLLDLKKKKSDLSEELTKIEENISNFSFDELEELTSQQVVLKSKIETQKEIDQYNKITKENNKLIQEERDKDLTTKLELEKEKKSLLQTIEYKTTAKKILVKDFPNYIIQQTIQDVEDRMNTFVEEIQDKGLNLKLHGTATSLKFLCGYNKKKLRDVRSLSGAEKFLIALSFVNIFNQELNLNCILMDEVDSAMNTENTKKLFQIIQSLPYEQVFLITHNNIMQHALIEEGGTIFNFN